MSAKYRYKIVVGDHDDPVGKEYKSTAKTRKIAYNVMEKRIFQLGYGGWGKVLELNESGEYVEIERIDITY